MTTFGITMVKDEADVIEGTLRHMADEVDRLIVADNMSTDGTREILDRLAMVLPMQVVDDLDPAYYQSLKMTALAKVAASQGATWIVPFDADEVWTAPHHGRIREVLDGLDGANVAHATLYNHLCTALDVDDPDPFRSMVWRQRDPGALGKVAFRWEPGAVIEQGNHGVWLPSDIYAAPILQVSHFPYRSAAQFTRKGINGAAAYAHTDLPEDWGAHWRGYGRLADSLGEQTLGDVFREHFHHLSPIDAGLIRDPAPYMRWAQ